MQWQVCKLVVPQRLCSTWLDAWDSRGTRLKPGRGATRAPQAYDPSRNGAHGVTRRSRPWFSPRSGPVGAASLPCHDETRHLARQRQRSFEGDAAWMGWFRWLGRLGRSVGRCPGDSGRGSRRSGGVPEIPAGVPDGREVSRRFRQGFRTVGRCPRDSGKGSGRSGGVPEIPARVPDGQDEGTGEAGTGESPRIRTRPSGSGVWRSVAGVRKREPFCGWASEESLDGSEPWRIQRQMPQFQNLDVGGYHSHSHSMVPGGLLVMSKTQRFTPFTSLMMREARRSRRS